MTSVDGRDLAGLLAAIALTASAPLGEALHRWSHHRARAAESFTAGASLAYVILDLMVELTSVGGQQVHATLPIAPTYEKSLFAIVLAGATWWYIIGAVASKRSHERARYRAFLLPQLVYGMFVGGALGLEAQRGTGQVLLFALPMLLHLTVVESHIHHEFAGKHAGVSRAAVAIAPTVGAVAWVLLGLPQAALFMALALVAGSTVVQIIQTELPSPDLVRIGPFLLGVSVYSAFVAARWAGG